MKCNMCNNEYEVMMQNPWGDIHILCKDCVPKFKAHFWPKEEEK